MGSYKNIKGSKYDREIDKRLNEIESIFALNDEKFINAIYKYILNREPDNEGYFHYLKLLKLKGKPLVVKNILLSKEYNEKQFKKINILNKKLTSTEFTWILYHKFFGRAPDLEGLKHYSELTNNLNYRELLINEFKKNDEYLVNYSKKTILRLIVFGQRKKDIIYKFKKAIMCKQRKNKFIIERIENIIKKNERRDKLIFPEIYDSAAIIFESVAEKKNQDHMNIYKELWDIRLANMNVYLPDQTEMQRFIHRCLPSNDVYISDDSYQKEFFRILSDNYYR